MFLWERLLLCNIPYEDSDGGDGDNGGTTGGGDNSPMGGPGAGYGGDAGSNFSASDNSGTADFGGGPGSTGGIGGAEGYGGGGTSAEANAEAGANIANTSGGVAEAIGNALGTGNVGVIGGTLGALGADAISAAADYSGFSDSSLAQAAASPTASISAPGISPATSVSQPGISPSVGVSPTTATTSANVDALGARGSGGFGLSGVVGGSPGAQVAGGLGGLGSLGAPSGVPGLGNTGPQGFAATESGFAPSSTAANVSEAMGALGLGGTMAGYASDTANIGSSLAAAAAGEDTGLADIGVADPTGMSTGFTGFGTGNVSISSVPGTIGANIGPAAQTPGALAAPVGTQAASVGIAPSVGIAGLTAAQLSNQLDSMTQPSAQATIGNAAPSVSPYGFSGMDVSGLTNLGGTQSISAPAQSAAPSAPAATTGSSMAAAAAGAPAGTPGRSASSISVDTFADPLTGAPVSVTNMNGEESLSIGAAPTAQSGIASIASNPITSAIVNAGLTAAVPGYGLANLGSMALTGTSIYGQGVSLATGQGLQTGGGIMGLAGSMGQPSGIGPSISGPGPAPSVAQGGGGGDIVPVIQVSSGEPQQYGQEVIAPVVETTPSPIRFNIADFIARPRNTSQSPFLYSDYLPVEGYRA